MASVMEGAVATPGRAESGSRPGVLATEALLLLMAVIWGVNFSVVKFGVSEIAPLAYNGLRVAAAAAALLLVGALAVRERWPGRRDTLALLALGVLGNCVYQVFFIEGMARTGAGTAALILAAGPAVIALLGRLRGVERVTRRGAVGIALSIAGVALVMFGTGAAAGRSSLVGDLLLFGGCVAWSVFTVLLTPYTQRVDGVHLSALTMAGGAVPMLAIAGPELGAMSWAAVTVRGWGAVAYSSLAALVVAYLIWYRGVRVIGPTRTALFGNLQPFIALVVAWLAFGEVPTAVQAVGAVAIMIGIVLTRR
jgi:drug/metabolite transporter (DMT)-like permease